MTKTKESVTPARFKVGDRVTLTNDQGVVFAGKTITETEVGEKGYAYYITPTDAPWFAVPERQLSLEAVESLGFTY